MYGLISTFGTQKILQLLKANIFFNITRKVFQV